MIKRALVAFVALMALPATSSWGEDVLRAGIIGCDTSHVPAFTKLINDPAAEGAMARVEVVVAFPGGSPDLAASRDRVEGYTAQLRNAGVEIVDSIDALVAKCDVILIESVDGRVHLDQFRQAAKGRPIFIDKPAAATLADVVAIGKVAKETDTPCFTSSALRYCEGVTRLQSRKDRRILGCEVASPYTIEKTHSDFFWYGIHGVESIYALMGIGCEEVTCVETDIAAVAVGKWGDGRLATYRGIKQGKSDYSFATFSDRSIEHAQGFSGYQPLAEEICKFLVSGESPVPWDETIEMFAFMEAAKQSKEQGGKAIRIADVLKDAGYSE